MCACERIATVADDAQPSRSNAYTMTFAAAVCFVCAVVVSAAAVGLAPRRTDNARLSRQRKVLAVAAIAASPTIGQRTEREVERLFAEHIEARAIVLATGEPAPDIDTETLDPRLARLHGPRPAPDNGAGIIEVPTHAVVYEIHDGDAHLGVILPVAGKGLWSTMRGLLAVEADGKTVRGMVFYEHGETPGLGGEIDDAAWLASFRGRRLFDDDGQPALRAVRGKAPVVAVAPHAIDGISGASLTTDAVEQLLHFWSGEGGYGPYLARVAAMGRDSVAIVRHPSDPATPRGGP